jgi:hypothetical protein
MQNNLCIVINLYMNLLKSARDPYGKRVFYSDVLVLINQRKDELRHLTDWFGLALPVV